MKGVCAHCCNRPHTTIHKSEAIMERVKFTYPYNPFTCIIRSEHNILECLLKGVAPVFVFEPGSQLYTGHLPYPISSIPAEYVASSVL